MLTKIEELTFFFFFLLAAFTHRHRVNVLNNYTNIQNSISLNILMTRVRSSRLKLDVIIFSIAYTCIKHFLNKNRF